MRRGEGVCEVGSTRRGGGYPSLCRLVVLSATLWNRDGGVVAVRGVGEGSGAAGGIGVGTRPGRRAARGRCRNRGHERAGRLSEAIGRGLSQIGESRRQRPHVGGEQAYG